MDKPIVFKDKNGKTHTLNSGVYFKVFRFNGKDNCIMMITDHVGKDWKMRFIRPIVWHILKPYLTFLFSIDSHTYYKYIKHEA